ncbi:MAG: peptidoglycan DD-metalloendopeptidase family protein [Ignavibacteria bacterium]|nr:peptidoglycan DD-metalloendopeptidase family protein [Ignavibacteria bacterium]
MKAGKNTTIFFRLIYFGLFLIAISLVLWGWIGSSDEEAEVEQVAKIELKPNQFGFYSDSLIVQKSTVLRNETLSDILLTNGASGNTIAQIVENSKNVFDVRKIRAGNTYYTYSSPDTNNRLHYFVYEKNPVNHVVFNVKDSVSVYEGKKEIQIKTNTREAQINHSLYVALMESDASPELAIKLSQVFAWQVDFYHLQKGDYFKVIFEEEFIQTVDNKDSLKFVGIGKILGAYFNHNSKEYYAVPFVQGSVYQFFDENGNSLRKAFLKAPLEFGRISSRFSRSRLHPVLKVRRPHLGVDYAAPTGTPVRTTGDGMVVEASYKGGNGKYIKVRHNSVYTTMYLHLSRFGKGIKRGVNVQQGQVIGYVGSTGLSTGPHLDYRFYINGSPVDPLKVEVPPSHPVKEELKADYNKVKQNVLQKLDSIVIEFNQNGPA